MKSKLPEGWKEVKLKDIIELTMGQSPKSEYYNEIGKGMPFMQGNTTFGDKYPAIERYTTKITRLAKRNDLLMSVRAPVGALNFCNIDELCIGRGLCSLRMKNNMQEFLYFLMKHSMQKLKTRETGTVFASINKSAIQNFVVNIPPLKEQKAIADTLSVIDDKIELNNKINKNLEKQSQALFKHWFIDFEFPDENGNPYKSSGGEMIESELGFIPKGWEIENLETIVSIKYGKNLPTKDLKNKGYPVFGGNGIIGYYDEYIYKEPEILIACRGAASGKVNISKPKSFVTNNSLVLESPSREIYEYLKNRFKFEDLKRFVTGSAQPQITVTNIKSMKLILPNTNIILKFNNLSMIMSKIILRNENENEKLSRLRETLLPKLMNGEIRIPLD